MTCIESGVFTVDQWEGVWALCVVLAEMLGEQELSLDEEGDAWVIRTRDQVLTEPLTPPELEEWLARNIERCL